MSPWLLNLYIYVYGWCGLRGELSSWERAGAAECKRWQV